MEKYHGINKWRRRIMHGLTSKVGNSPVRLTEPSQIKKILVCRPNGRLGNLLLLTPLIRELQSAFPEAQIHLFVKGGHARNIFRYFPQVSKIIALPEKPFRNLPAYFASWIKLRASRYDLVFNADPGSSSGRLSTKFAGSRSKLFGDADSDIANRYPDAAHMAKNPVLRLREYMAALNITPRHARLPEMTLCLTPSEMAHGRQKLQDLIRNPNPIVCLYTYATGSKDFGKQWWHETLQLLRREFPTVNLIEVLPAHGASAVDYKIPSVYSLNIREIGSVLANSRAFIGADCGIMHLASAAGVPTMALFKTSRKEKYAPYNRQSTGIDMNTRTREDLVRHLARILGPKAMLTGLSLSRELAN